MSCVIVLPPVPTSDIKEDSESIDKLSTGVRSDMLDTLKDISVRADKKTQ